RADQLRSASQPENHRRDAWRRWYGYAAVGNQGRGLSACLVPGPARRSGTGRNPLRQGQPFGQAAYHAGQESAGQPELRLVLRSGTVLLQQP
nr:hypothetical protein [Tanacetum cinerariifolium]